MKNKNTKHWTWIRVALISLWCGVRSGWALPPQDLYKEAQLQENTSRNLEEAIRLYKEYLEATRTDRVAQAEAWLHLGLCHERLGHEAEAKNAWNVVVQDYSDVPTPYNRALSELQRLQMAEKVPIEVRTSTPVVKVVYAPPPSRLLFEWMELSVFYTVDSKGSFLASDATTTANLPHSLVYYVTPDIAFGLEGRRLFSSDEYFETQGVPTEPFAVPFPDFTLHRSVAYIAPIARFEKKLPFGFAPFIKVGPAAYRFHFESAQGTSTTWAPGITSEAGLSLGWSRGFTLSLGYSLLGFVQRTPTIDQTTLSQTSFDNPGSITQAHGWRWVGGPSIKLGYRW